MRRPDKDFSFCTCTGYQVEFFRAARRQNCRSRLNARGTNGYIASDTSA